MKEEKEIWKPVVGYEGYYEVSSFGNVRSLDRYVPYTKIRGGKYIKGRLLKPSHKYNGYLQVSLLKDNKAKYVSIHRLVASTFIKNPYNKPTVNHLDENKHNNHANNLEWATQQENSTYNDLPRRTSLKRMKKVIQFNDDGFYREWESTMSVKTEGYNQGHVAECCRGERKFHHGYKWKYAE